MNPNIIINRDGLFEVTADLKSGSLLLHQDFPLGLAMRDFEKGDTVEYDSNSNTKDVAIKAEWDSQELVEKIISKSPPSHPLSVLDLGKTIIFDPEANKGSVSLEPAREPDE